MNRITPEDIQFWQAQMAMNRQRLAAAQAIAPHRVNEIVRHGLGMGSLALPPYLGSSAAANTRKVDQ